MRRGLFITAARKKVFIPLPRIDGSQKMLTYKAMYKFCDDGVHAEVLDFPGAISCGADLDDARDMLQSALVDMAETHLLNGEPLPVPDPNVFDDESDIEEPIQLNHEDVQGSTL